MRINVTFSATEAILPVRFAAAPTAIPVSFGHITGVEASDPYTGPYTVTPDFAAITLPTTGLRMQQDLVLAPIPVAEVANPAGGKTCIIGG